MTPNNGNRAVANVYHKEKTPQVVNSAATYDKNTQEPLSQATYRFGRVQNSVYMDGVDHEANTGVRFDDMDLSSKGTAGIGRDTAETLVNVNKEQIINETMNFWRSLNKSLLQGSATISPARTGHATKIYGLNDLTSQTGASRFGLTVADIGYHDFEKPTVSNTDTGNARLQPRWQAVQVAPASGVLRLFGAAANSLTTGMARLAHQAHSYNASAALNAEYAILMGIDVYNMITDALKGNARWNLAEGAGAGADPNISIWKTGYTLDQFNARFFVDSDMPAGIIYAYNKNCLRLAQIKPTKTLSAGNIYGKWRLQQDSDNLLLPMNKQCQLWSDDLSQLLVITGITSVTL